VIIVCLLLEFECLFFQQAEQVREAYYIMYWVAANALMLWSISLGPRFECFEHLPIGLGKEYSTNAALEQCSQLSSPSVFFG